MPAATCLRTVSSTAAAMIAVEVGGVDRVAALGGEQQVGHGLRARQAADVGGEDAVGHIAVLSRSSHSECGGERAGCFEWQHMPCSWKRDELANRASALPSG